MSDSSTEFTRHEIKIDLQGLIRLLAKNLYSESDVFVREIIQNAYDSIVRRKLIEQNPPSGIIHLYSSYETSSITFDDNGSGLTQTEIHDYLSTIGRSGTYEFRQNLLKRGRQAEESLIGQFGIGLLSAFVVAHRVEIETLSCQPGNKAWHWKSEGQKDYELQQGSRHEIGTSVTLYISDNYRDMLNAEELRKAIKKYADFIPCQILLNEETNPVNSVNAPWDLGFATEQDRIEEYWSFVNRRFPDYALEVIPVDLQTPHKVNGVLYISDQHVPDVNTTGMVDIYQAGMFITGNNRDLLPSWAKFVRGIIDSPDLTPTASRDAIQLDSIASEIRDALGNLVVQHLKKMALSNPTRFERIMEWHSYYVKAMAVAHNDFFDAIADLVPFETNKGLMNLRRYCDLSPHLESRLRYDIFYFNKPDSATQFYMLCNAKGMLVINASSVFEEQFLEKYAQRHPEIYLHLISKAGSDFLFEQVSPEEAEKFRDLEIDFQKFIPDPTSQVHMARFKPSELPAVAISTADSLLLQELEHIKENIIIPESVRGLVTEMLDERPNVPVNLYLNVDNPTIQQMAKVIEIRSENPEIYQAAMASIYNNAFLLSQRLRTPDNAQIIFNSSNHIIQLLIDLTRKLIVARSQIQTLELSNQEKAKMKLLEQKKVADTNEGQTKLTQHITCMVALPFENNSTFAYETVLLPALEAVLEQAPYYWQVIRTDQLHYDNVMVVDNAWLKKPHVYIADISDLDSKVVKELGYMLWVRENWQPVILLERAQTGAHLVDIEDVIRMSYPATIGRNAVIEIADALRKGFAKNENIQRLNLLKREHYLSPLLLRDTFGVKDDVAADLAMAFVTMENFVNANVENISRSAKGLSRYIASGLREAVADLLNELIAAR